MLGGLHAHKGFELLVANGVRYDEEMDATLGALFDLMSVVSLTLQKCLIRAMKMVDLSIVLFAMPFKGHTERRAITIEFGLVSSYGLQPTGPRLWKSAFEEELKDGPTNAFAYKA